MQRTRSNTCLRLLGVVAAIAVMGLPTALEAQLAVSRSNERVLLLPPIPMAGTDTAFAVELGNELRDRMESKYRFKLRIIPGETICEALEASGFPCDRPLPAENASALARFLQARGYMVGWLEQTADSMHLTLRLVDAAGSGLSGWMTVANAAGESAKDFARDVADALEDPIDAAEQARECDARRGRSDFSGARDRVRRAFEKVPNHPSAAMCLALLFEVQGAPNDSLIFALERAVQGDSLNARAWERVGRRYLAAGDTARGIDAFEMQLNAEPNNMQLRHGVAVARMRQVRYGDAVEILQYALDRNPLDVPTLQLKARACVEGEIWGCALDALTAQYDVDSSLVGDTIFYARVFGAAQALEDTSAMLQWSGEAVERVPSSVRLWSARAAALKSADDREGALNAYDQILALDSTQVASALAAAQLLLDSTLVIDTLTPLDTARLLKGDSLLRLVAAQRGDTATQLAVAGLYYNPGSKIAQARLMPHLMLAADFLEKTLTHDLRGAYEAPANFFLSLALFFNVTELDTEVRESESCELARTEESRLARARAAMEAGRTVSEQTAAQILEFLTRYEAAVESYFPAWECPAPPPPEPSQ